MRKRKESRRCAVFLRTQSEKKLKAMGLRLVDEGGWKMEDGRGTQGKDRRSED
jgi:hypothetical protein